MIRAVVVEDEPLARRYLVDLLTGTGRVDVVGEAETAPQGLSLCTQAGVDVAFVDIRLPGPDGLALGMLLARLPYAPLIVFVTGYADYAVDAFRLHAADYLLKPLERERVEEAVLHLEQRQRERCTEGHAVEDPAEDRLPVRLRDRDVARLLGRHEIVAVLRRGRRTLIHTPDAEYPSYYPVAGLQAWLGGSPFLRAARDAIVNLAFVAEITHYGDRLYRLRLMDRPRTVVDVSRSAASALVSVLRPRV